MENFYDGLPLVFTKLSQGSFSFQKSCFVILYPFYKKTTCSYITNRQIIRATFWRCIQIRHFSNIVFFLRGQRVPESATEL